MKALLTLIALAAAAAVSAQITSLPPPPFLTSPGLIESYDALPPGSKPSIPVFTGHGTASRIGTGGALLIGGFGSPLTPPNMMFGRGVDVRIRVKPEMTFFGGFFKQAPAGIKVANVTFTFFDIGGVAIGSVTKPLTTAWKWIGFRTKPKWARVDVVGSGTPHGYVAFDQTRIKP